MSSLRSKRRKTQKLYEALVEESVNDNPSFPTELSSLPSTSDSCVISEDPQISDADSISFSDYSNISDSSLSDDEHEDKDENRSSFRSDLGNWAVKHNITATAIDELLVVLRDQVPNSKLPKSSKTLLRTPKSYEISKIAGGLYFHFGLENQLKFFGTRNLIQVSSSTLLLTVGIDGVNVSLSSKKIFWPILGLVDGVNNSKPFLIGLYFAEKGKPDSVSEFLAPFVEELIKLFALGWLFGEKKFSIKLKCIVADAPARNYIKYCISFNGYHGCDRCTQKGEWKGRVIFPNQNSELRTDESFLLQSDPRHHAGVSPLVNLGIGLVSDIVLDYMHLVCQGVMKKLLYAWNFGPIPHKLGRFHLNSISERLVSYILFIPKEFNRTPRSVVDLKWWKATEYRTFLLYVGPVALKGILSTEKYHHFLLLSISIRILLSDNRNWYDYARKLLKQFVLEIPDLYASEFLVYNVHSLVHLADDAEKFGSLENVSAYPFENYMQFLKRRTRAKRNELPQVIRRVYEHQINYNFSTESQKKVDSLALDKANSAVLLNNGEVAVLSRIESTNESLICRKFLRKVDFFTYPCSSSQFGIYKVFGLSPEFKISRKDVKRKVMLLPFNGEIHPEQGDELFVSMPLLSGEFL